MRSANRHKVQSLLISSAQDRIVIPLYEIDCWLVWLRLWSSSIFHKHVTLWRRPCDYLLICCYFRLPFRGNARTKCSISKQLVSFWLGWSFEVYFLSIWFRSRELIYLNNHYHPSQLLRFQTRKPSPSQAQGWCYYTFHEPFQKGHIESHPLACQSTSTSCRGFPFDSWNDLCYLSGTICWSDASFHIDLRSLDDSLLQIPWQLASEWLVHFHRSDQSPYFCEI